MAAAPGVCSNAPAIRDTARKKMGPVLLLNTCSASKDSSIRARARMTAALLLNHVCSREEEDGVRIGICQIHSSRGVVERRRGEAPEFA